MAAGGSRAGDATGGPRRDSFASWLRQTLRTGGPGQCIWAINNGCNAGCGFCNFALDRLPRSDWAAVPLDRARRAIDVLHRLFVRYLIVTGGEPLLHPNVDDIIAHARQRGLTVLLVTNGSRLTEPRVRELAALGVSTFVISIDAETAEAHERNRRLPGVCEKIRAANRVLRELGVQSTASVTISRLVQDETALVEFVRSLGFTDLTFSYPLTGLSSSFLGYGRSELVEFSADELDARFERIKRLKKTFPILNPAAGIEEMQRFLRGEEQRFECLGGYRYFYLDWSCMLWRCHHWDAPICSIEEMDESRYVRDGCTSCMIDCFRDASVMQHVAVSASDALRDAASGRLVSAARRLVRGSNAESLSAAAEALRWLGHLRAADRR
jgi:MoaA/NifB/PqqE/SkfB family radical SAM enzyme